MQFSVAALGELLIDFTECGVSTSGMKLFERNPGGAVANVLAAVTKLGGSTAFLGKVGNDIHGQFLKSTLEEAGINTQGLILAEDVFTTLAFVALSASGERTFSFARKPGADTQLTVREVNDTVIQNARILHIGSLSMTDEPARSATLCAIVRAKEMGKFVSYDPNYRATLWLNEEVAKARMRELLPYVDIIKLSDEETGLLTERDDPAEAAAFLNARGISCVAVTLGKRGALVGVDGRCKIVPGYPLPSVDTTGAGDAFWGGVLYKILESGKYPCRITLLEMADYADFGNAVATCCVQKRGAIPAMPEMEDVLLLMRKYRC